MVTAGFDHSELKGMKGLLLDIDNTLYAYEPTHRAAQAHCLNQMQQRLPGHSLEQLSHAYSQARKRIHTDLHGTGASHHRLLYFHRMIEQLNGRADVALALEAEEWYWGHFLENMQLHPAAAAFLNEARQQRLKICVVTDLVAQIQYRKLIKLGLADAVDFVVSSEEAGVEKPHPYIFRLALEKLGMQAEEVLMVGDSLDKDILGAQLLGIKALTIML